jgi:NADH-quinone oxidoreductase subunit G
MSVNDLRPGLDGTPPTIITDSETVKKAREGVLEFLLINHPLDCPICDQGGECELQDLAMGYGRDISRYAERKRVVKDKNLGPLVSTDMTRCIHCTRCVRFGQEIQGIQELGTVGRGEFMQISTWIEKSVDHELSGNIIDLCPVGALNNKPYRYRARAWEMTQHPLVSPHDCVGTNLYGHVLRGRLMRVVPRANDAINETWIADRDRFSCEGLYTDDRARQPLVKQGGEWREVDWETALDAAASGLREVVQAHGPQQLGVLGSPISTLEELYLATRLARGLGTENIDHRLRRVDFRDQGGDPVAPLLGCTIAELGAANAILLVGCNVRMEAPLIAHRVRKAAIRAGTSIGLINPRRYDLKFAATQLVSNGLGMVQHLAGVLLAASRSSGRAVPENLAQVVEGVQPSAEHERLAAALGGGERHVILLGAIAQNHVAFSELRALAAAIADVTGATLGYVPEGGNAVGASLAGTTPHRGAGGRPVRSPGLPASEMLNARLKGYLLVGPIEGADLSTPARGESAFGAAQCVVALTPFADEHVRSNATVILPIAAFPETSGTWVNVEGTWQSVPGAAAPPGSARPGWKVLRVLGNLLNLTGFDYTSSDEIRDELKHELGEFQREEHRPNLYRASRVNGVDNVREVGIYDVDAIVRRSRPLQETVDAHASARVNG